MVAEGGAAGAPGGPAGTSNGVPAGPQPPAGPNGPSANGPGPNGPTEEGYLLVKVHVPELNVQKCLQFPRDQLVWEVKQQCLAALPKVSQDNVFLMGNNRQDSSSNILSFGCRFG